MSEIVYLSIPYSSNPVLSFEIANKVAANLMKKGYVVFSPISHSHPIAQYLDKSLLLDHEFWMKQDLPMIGRCAKMFVIVVHGEDTELLVNKSSGCKAEMKEANRLNIPIEYIHYVFTF